MKYLNLNLSILVLLMVSLAYTLQVEAHDCKPSGKIKGQKAPQKKCNKKKSSDYCKEGKSYRVFDCSPPVTKKTKAILTLNGFEKGEGRGKSECDNQYHSNKLPVVALSTGWFNKKSRCLRNITIHGNGKTATAMVVDECDSRHGCDEQHDYRTPCDNNIVEASAAVWQALGVSSSKRGKLKITWSDNA